MWMLRVSFSQRRIWERGVGGKCFASWYWLEIGLYVLETGESGARFASDSGIDTDLLYGR